MEEPPNKKKKRGGRIAVLVLLAVVLLAGIFAWASRTKFTLKNMDTGEGICIGANCEEELPPARSALAVYAEGPLSQLQTLAATPPAPAYVFKTRAGTDTTFAAFKGKVVLINLWAMWCAPCRTEMPTIAALATAYADRPLVVLPVNVDTGTDKIADATSFIDVHEPLPFYNDPKFQLPFEFPGKGKMPQTILLDRQGRIRASFSGEADWNSPEAHALIDALLAEPG